MNRAMRVSLSTLALAALFFVPAALAQSASGGFHVVTVDGNRNVEFNAKIHPNGSASGNLKLSIPITVGDQDVDEDGTGDPGTTTTNLSVRIDVDCLRVKDNRAALSGLVRESSVGAYVGRRIIFTVEDGGEGSKAAPDRYTWGQYRSTAPTWIASDAELVFDPGVGLTWTATDFERTDDAGVSSSQPADVDCKSFPLSSYALEDLPQGSGNIQVKP